MKTINTHTEEIKRPFGPGHITLDEVAEDIALKATDLASNIAEVTSAENNTHMTSDQAHALEVAALRKAAQYLLDEANERAEDYKLEVTN